MKLRLIKTCEGCPEQYDVFNGDDLIGYMRLRHGYFRAEYPVDNIVYEAYPTGDGVFEYDERHKYLNEASLAIIAKLSIDSEDTYYTVEESDG
jgi:hypothetical protein